MRQAIRLLTVCGLLSTGCRTNEQAPPMPRYARPAGWSPLPTDSHVVTATPSIENRRMG
jgi:hypothetical protein